MGTINKARFWTGVLYPENMLPNWEEVIGDKLQIPYAYCKHDKDSDVKSEHRKDHVHILVAYSNTTTYKHALEVFDQLSAPGKKAINTCEAVISVRGAYDYLIHDTDSAKKAGKHQYDPSERITGNNFDIGSYEQLSKNDKLSILRELGDIIAQEGFEDFMSFYMYVVSNYSDDSNYFEVLYSYSGFFERLTRGNYLQNEKKREANV